MMKAKINKMETVPKVQNKVRQRGKNMKMSKANKVEKSNSKIKQTRNENLLARQIEFWAAFI